MKKSLLFGSVLFGFAWFGLGVRESEGSEGPSTGAFARGPGKKTGRLGFRAIPFGSR